MKRRYYLRLQSILRELVCLSCVVLLIASKATAQEADATTPAASKSSPRPDWVGKQPYQEGDTYVWPVVSGPPNGCFSSTATSENELRENAVAAAKNFIEIRLIREEEAGEVLSRNNELRKLTLKEILAPDRYVESVASGGLNGYRTHGILRFTPDVTRELERRWQQHLSNPTNYASVQFDSTLAWGPIFFLVILVFVVWLVVNRRSHPSLLKFVPVAILVSLFAGYWMLESKESRSRQQAQTRLTEIGLAFEAGGTSRSRSASKQQEVKLPAEADSVPEAKADSVARTPALQPPWANDPPQKQGDDYFVVVRSGQISDLAMREEALRVKMVAAADRYIDEILYRDGKVSAAVNIDAAYLREHCVASEYHWAESGSDETFVKLKFDRQFRNEVKARYQRYVSTSRVEQLGGVTLGVLGVLAAALAVLKFTQPRDAGIKRSE